MPFQPFYINRFQSGLVTQRSPLVTPYMVAGLQVIERKDALIDGSNMELNPRKTLQRRPGFPNYSSAAFGASEWPLNFYAHRKNDGSITTYVDTQTNVYTFTPGVNAIPNPDGTDAAWVGDSGLVFNATGGLAGSGGKWTYTGTGSASTFRFRKSVTFSVVPGATYRLSGYIDASHVTSIAGGGVPNWDVYDPTVSTPYANVGQAIGVSGRVSATFTVPGGVTQVVVIFDTNNCTVANGTSLIFSNPQLELGSSISTYTNKGALNSVFTKSGGSGQTQFQALGDSLYFVNGVDIKKIVNSVVSNMGIVAPTVAASVSVGAGVLSPTAGYRWVFVYKNSATGTTSSAGPETGDTGPQTTKNFTLSGARSTDPQVDKIDIYRLQDGGDTYMFLAEIANPPSGTWSYTDSSADTALNDQVLAPVNGINDPPSAGMSNLTEYQGRMFGTVGNLLYFSAGGDATNNVREESWPPDNVLTLPGKITALEPSAGGLMVMTSDTISLVLGGPETLSYYIQVWLPTTGVLSQNTISTDTEELFLYTTNRQLWSISAGGNKNAMGDLIGDLLQSTFNPTNCSLSAHRNGLDEGVFLSDGSSKILRYSMSLGSWSTVATIVGGVGFLSSLETSSGTFSLLAGRPAGSGHILVRDLNTFTDGTTAYAGNFILGSLQLCAPGTPLYPVESIIIDRSIAGSDPSLSLNLGDIAAGTFVNVTDSVPDPPNQFVPTGIVSKRFSVHSISGYTAGMEAKHIQLKITLPTEAAKNEILSIAIQPSGIDA